jgi:hypothetical protein
MQSTICFNVTKSTFCQWGVFIYKSYNKQQINSLSSVNCLHNGQEECLLYGRNLISTKYYEINFRLGGPKPRLFDCQLQGRIVSGLCLTYSSLCVFLLHFLGLPTSILFSFIALVINAFHVHTPEGFPVVKTRI